MENDVKPAKLYCYNTPQQGGNESKNGRPWYAQSKLCPAICKRSSSATKIGDTSNQLLTTSSRSEVKLGASSTTGGMWDVINLFWLIISDACVIWKTMELCCLKRSLKVIVIEEETFNPFAFQALLTKHEAKSLAYLTNLLRSLLLMWGINYLCTCYYLGYKIMGGIWVSRRL